MLLFCFEKPILTQIVVTIYLKAGCSSDLYFLLISCSFSASLCGCFPLSAFSLASTEMIRRVIRDFGRSKCQLYQAEVAVLGAVSFANVLFYEDTLFTRFFASAVLPA